MHIKSPRDFWAGLMFIGFGMFFAVWAAVNYQMGSALRMGPAYFPAVLGGLLVVLGAIVFAQSLIFDGAKVAPFHFRPLLLVLAAAILFGYAMKPLGLVVSIALLVFVSAFGGHEFKWKEVVFLYIFLAVFSVMVFVKGLSLPFPLWPEFLGY
jgi:hypothetical protein